MTELVRLYLRLPMVSLRSQMQYRAYFLLEVVRLVLNYLAVMISVWIVLQRFPALRGWTFGETALLFGLAVLSWGLTLPLFFHFLDVEHYVERGTLDRFLVRPLPVFLQVMADRFQVIAAGQAVFAVVAFAVAGRHVDVDWTPGRAALLLVSLVSGTLIQGALVLCVSAISFWTLRARRFYWVFVRPAREMAWFPVSVYPRPLQAVLVFVLPVAFVNFFPAQVLLGKHDPAFPAWMAYAGPAVAAAAFGGALALWHAGLRRYEGTGS